MSVGLGGGVGPKFPGFPVWSIDTLVARFVYFSTKSRFVIVIKTWPEHAEYAICNIYKIFPITS